MTAESNAGPVGIIGLWHQGIVAAAVLADRGYDVVAADPDHNTVDTLRGGESPIYEPGLNELIQSGAKRGALRWTTDLREAGARPSVWLAVDTPVNERDESDLAPVWEAVETIAPVLPEGAVLLITAQVPVGSCDEIRRRLRAGGAPDDVGLAYSPENLRLGQAIERMRTPPLPVIGADGDRAFERAVPLLGEEGIEFKRVSLRTAEMSKHALNAFLATTVTFANELGNLCDEMGANGQDIASILRMEPRVGPKAMLFPGMGFSGGTLARDMQTLRAIGDRTGLETPMLDGIWSANERQNDFVERKLTQSLGGLKGRTLAVFGLTYKPGTSTLRRSAALDIIDSLHRAGATIRAHDPQADRGELAGYDSFTFCEDPYVAVEGADALVIVTAWPQYRETDYRRVQQRMAGTTLIDCNNMLNDEAMLKAGFNYLDIGRGHRVKGD